jgi:hypothetical protein
MRIVFEHVKILERIAALLDGMRKLRFVHRQPAQQLLQGVDVLEGDVLRVRHDTAAESQPGASAVAPTSAE